MLIVRGGNWPEHRGWFRFVVLATIATIAWYAAEALAARQWPGGSSRPGFAYGLVGGIIIVFEMLLAVRKKYRVVRIGRAKLWMKAHIWLGLLTLPLLVLHSGFRYGGGSLSDVLMVLFLLVVASGIWGLVLQQYIPARMLEEIPAETIHSQIDYILNQVLVESRRLVRLTCGQEDAAGDGDAAAATEGAERGSFLVIGAVRTAGRVQGKVLQTRSQIARVPESQALLVFFEQNVEPFFLARDIRKLPLASAKRAGVLFREVKTLLDPAAHGVVDTLEDLCDQRRQLARQARLHNWLHGWLAVHLPLSFALLVLMIYHVIYALKYF